MSGVGSIYVDPSTNRKYKCTAKISVSPTLFNKQVLTSGVWKVVSSAGSESGEAPNTIILEDEYGNRIVAVLVGDEVVFDATANDIREGKVAATEEGVTVGEKFIPSYIATQGYTIIPSGYKFSVKLPVNNLYDYSKFQAMICAYNSSVSDSVSCEQVVINDNLYDVLTTASLQKITIDSENKTIELGITNTTDSPYLIRYFTLKEV